MAHTEIINIEARARDLITKARAAHSGRAAQLVRGGPDTPLTQTVIALDAGASLSEHENPGEATVLVLEGQVRLIAADHEWRGARGDVINVPPTRHSLHADTVSVILLTAVKQPTAEPAHASRSERPASHPAEPAPTVEDLSVSDCWSLLRTGTVARLAVWVDDHPDIFPLNYVVDHASIVFRSREGTKLAGALTDTPVAMEVDGYSAETSRAWSVVLKGRARAIEQTEELLDTFALSLFPWQGGTKNRFIRIVPDVITGRRFPVVDADSWLTPLSDVRRTPSE